MTEIDLNAYRAARREANKDPIVVKLGERSFTLPVELPIGSLQHFQALGEGSDPAAVSAAVLGLLEQLLGPEFEGFMEEQPSLGDLNALFEALMPAYGLESPGESPGSESSLASTSSP